MSHIWNWRQWAFLSPGNHRAVHSECRTPELMATEALLWNTLSHWSCLSATQSYQLGENFSGNSSPGLWWIIWGLAWKMVTGQERCFIQELWGVSPQLKQPGESENCPKNGESIWPALTSPHRNSTEPRGQLHRPHADFEHRMLSRMLVLWKWIALSYAELSLLPSPKKTIWHNQFLPVVWRQDPFQHMTIKQEEHNSVTPQKNWKVLLKLEQP